MPEPSIFGPDGDGYCRRCRYIQPLDEKGRLDVHYARFSNHLDVRGLCDGIGHQPATRTPFSSRLSRFVTRARTGWCPDCLGQHRTEVVREDGKPTMRRHSPTANSFGLCEGTSRLAYKSLRAALDGYRKKP